MRNWNCLIVALLIFSFTSSAFAASLSPVTGTIIYPHVKSSDGKTIVDPVIYARDYSSLILALSWVAKNSPADNKKNATRELVNSIDNTKRLFINPDGSIKISYEFTDGKYKFKDGSDIVTQANLAYGLIYPHHAAMGGHYDMSLFSKVQKDTAMLPIIISSYTFKNFVDTTNGGFYASTKKDKKT